MISQFFMVIVKIFVMLLILVGMVLLLVGLKHYLNRTNRRCEMDDSGNERFRRQISDDRGVLSHYNLFRKFFVEEEREDCTPTVPRFFQGEGRRRQNHSNPIRDSVRNNP